MTKSRQDLTSGPLRRRILKMTLPMAGGILAMSVFNLTDTFFVSRLGTESLAAMSFTFPVIMVVASVAMGLGAGVSSTVSRAIGEGAEHRVRRLVTDGLILTFILVGIFAIGGLLGMDVIFRAMGAEGDILVLVKSYMRVWFSCVAVVMLPMTGNNAIRATGDMVVPSLIMTAAAVINAILDPILIFGLLGAPALGIVGAAWATVVSRALGLVASICFLRFRYRLLELSKPPLRIMLKSWKSILSVSIPASASHMLVPLSSGFIMRFVAGFGPESVAGVGVGGRILMFSFVIPIAMGMSLTPFIGQNWGAGLFGRVRRGWLFVNGFSLVYGAVSFMLCLFFGNGIAGFFSDNPDVRQIIRLYLAVVSAASGLQHICVHTGFAFNAIGKPLYATGFMAIRMLALMVPLAFLGGHYFGITGIFAGVAAANAIAGMAAFIAGSKVLAPE